MNNTEKEKRKFPLKAIITFTSFLLLLTVASFIIFGLYPVKREVTNISGYIENQSENIRGKLPSDIKNMISEVREKEHLAAFLNTTLKLSRGDSIAFFIDLKDSLAILSYKGVSLFQTKISRIVINSGLKKLPIFFRDSLYSGPMEVKEEMSSIEKFPVVVKKAPKDTIEANMASAAPAPPTQNDVFIAFWFDNNLIIQMNQQEEELVGTKKEYKRYKRDLAGWIRAKNRKALLNKEERGYIYHLTIEVPRDDARSIYRALPLNPAVVVRY